MSSRNVLEKYLDTAKVTLIIAIVCAALCLVGIVGGIVSSANYVAPDAQPFYPNQTPAGDYVYIDAVIVSSWVYKTDDRTYYSAADADGYWYTVELSDTQFNAMYEQYDYFLNGTAESPLPAPHRISGLAANASDTIVEAFVSSWSLSGAEEYYSTFGHAYLNAKSSPSSGAAGLFTLLAFFAGIMALLMFVTALPKRRTMKKCLDRLEALGELDRAADQLSSPDSAAYKLQQIVFTRDFVLSALSGAALKYEDIYWSFMRIQRINFIKASETLVGGVPFCGIVNLAVNPVGKKNAGMLEQMMQHLSQRNPQMLLGYTHDNIVAFNNESKRVKSSSSL